MAATLITELAERALTDAVKTHQPGLLAHADRDRQYAGYDYQAQLRVAQIQFSMRRTRSLYDNALIESVWATLKVGLINDKTYASRTAAEQGIFQYIEGFCNQRRHSVLGNMSPTEFERRQTAGA
jgi:putative transposase